MADEPKKQDILPINIEDEMRQSYLDYSMSVIVGRALPDFRDGLKPVHRRVLYAMNDLNNDWNRAYKKSARVVGDVIGKYHPHGDTAVYDALVRMAQPFSLRYMLVDGQGNFGSVDGDPPAAMRYTEVRMARITTEILADIEKDTVDFVPNYDGAELEPAVMPTRLPNLLINGSTGIAVGMATNIPPHNLTEVANALLALIDNPELTIDDLMVFIPGPDFPTAGLINGARGIVEAYNTGRGRIYVRAKAHIEDDENSSKQKIIVTELPYQVNKTRLIERIAELVKDRKIEGITYLNDESDKDGTRINIELRRGEVPEVILNQLFQLSQLQTVFGINMVGLLDGRPQTLNLKQVLEAFLRHRREVVTRRTLFDLGKARDRAHVLEGLAVALESIDSVIELIRSSATPDEAKIGLLGRGWSPGVVNGMLERAGAGASRPIELGPQYGLIDGLYHLSPVQAQQILDMRLQRLTGLEKDKILSEYGELLEKIHDLLDILGSTDRLMTVIRDELIETRDMFADERRTEIIETREDFSAEDLIADEEVVLTLSHLGYAKAQPLTDYRAQRRGGRGKSATSVREEDFVEAMFVASTHDTILCFSTRGRLYWLKAYEIPFGGRGSRGRPIVNLLPLEGDERISAVLPIREFDGDRYLFFATAKGTVKKTPLVDYSRPRASGIIAIDLDESDHLVNVAITDGNREIMLFSDAGKGIRFRDSDVRSMGRNSRGVRGMRIGTDDSVIAMIAIEDTEGTILTTTENGYGKRTPISDYSLQGRGGQGVIAIQTTTRNGRLIGVTQIEDGNEIMLITNAGTLVRTRSSEISTIGRNAQGVKVIGLGKEELLIAIARIETVADDDESDEITESADATEPALAAGDPDDGPIADGSESTETPGDDSHDSESTDTPGDDPDA